MRKVTRQAAFEAGGWTPERAAKVRELFDGLAPGWSARFQADESAPLKDALTRGDVTGTTCLELGSGTGRSTAVLARRFDIIVSIDLSLEMLVRAPAEPGLRLLADCRTLPVRDKSIDVLVLENMFLFPAEVDRVLVSGGSVVWVSSVGDRTPIYMPAEDVLRALPGPWCGVTSEAGWGSWCVARRAE